MSNLRLCPDCDGMVSKDAGTCPHCGCGIKWDGQRFENREPDDDEEVKLGPLGWFFWLLIRLILFGGIAGLVYAYGGYHFLDYFLSLI